MFNVIVSLVLNFIFRKPLLKRSAPREITEEFKHTGANCFHMAALGMAHVTVVLMGAKEGRLLCGGS